MSDLDDELDAFLDSDEGEESQDQMVMVSDGEEKKGDDEFDVSDYDFVDSDDEIQVSETAPPAPTSKSNTEQTKTEDKDDETAKLQAQIAALQAKLQEKEAENKSPKKKVKKSKTVDSKKSEPIKSVIPKKRKKKRKLSELETDGVARKSYKMGELDSAGNNSSQTSEQISNQQSASKTIQNKINSIQKTSTNVRLEHIQEPDENCLFAPVQKSSKNKQTEADQAAASSAVTKTETSSGLRYTNAVSESPDKELSGRKYLPLHTIRPNSESDNSFTIAVVVQITQKTSSKGNDFGLIKISNLFNCPNASTLFLFGGAKQAHQSLLTEGCLIAIVEPKILSNRNCEDKSSQSSVPALSISGRNDLLLIARRCIDFGFCKGSQFTTSKEGKVSRNNTNCRNFVNLSLNPLCSYHLARGTSSKRGVFNSTAKPVRELDNQRRMEKAPKKIEKEFKHPETGERLFVDAKPVKCASNVKNSAKHVKIEDRGIVGGTRKFNQALNKATPGAKLFKASLAQKRDQIDIKVENSINRYDEGRQLAIGVGKMPITAMELRKAAAAKILKDSVDNKNNTKLRE